MFFLGRGLFNGEGIDLSKGFGSEYIFKISKRNNCFLEVN